MNAEQPSGQQGSHHRSCRHSRIEKGNSLGTIGDAKPMGEKHDDTGEETGLGRAEQQSRRIELARRSNKACKDRDESPGDHDAGDPLARAPSLDDDSARNLEQQVADKEKTRAKAVDAIAKAQVDAHAQIGERQVSAVDIADEVEQEYERQKMLRRPTPGALAYVLANSLHR